MATEQMTENFAVSHKNLVIEVTFLIRILLIYCDSRAPVNAIVYEPIRQEWLSCTCKEQIHQAE